jgi:hypothetical protein
VIDRPGPLTGLGTPLLRPAGPAVVAGQGRLSSPGAGGALAGRAAHEIKLVGDVHQLARGQLPTALG